MKNLKKKTLKSTNGITLIALVITIIVLLILAGISISMLSGDNGILQKATDAKTQTGVAQEKETIALAYNSALAKKVSNGNSSTITDSELDEELDSNEATASGNPIIITFTKSGNTYEIDSNGNIKEKDPNKLSIAELQENASAYFGYDIINYAEELPEELKNTEWQLFYAGALDGETDERIYLISKKYIENTKLPTVIKDGERVTTTETVNDTEVTTEVKPIINEYSNYKAYFSHNGSYVQSMGRFVIPDGIIPHYEGSSDIKPNLKNLNKKYFNFLNEDTSTNTNLKAVAFMMDTETWSPFANYYADYAIGGPTIEMLFTAYNKYKNKVDEEKYETQVVSKDGYKISIDGGENYKDEYNGIIENDVTSGTNKVDSPYSVSSLGGDAWGYWLASPGYASTKTMGVTWQRKCYTW